MALLVNPRLLIADEPTTALDATMEAQIVHLIRQMQDEFGGTVVFVSHNLGLIAELCDDVVIMYAGEVVERGSIFDIFENPQHPYTRRLLRCDPALIKVREPALPTIPGSVPDLRDPPKGCAFAARCIRAVAMCREQHPGETEGAPGHLVRCHMPGPSDTEVVSVPSATQAKVTPQGGAPIMAVRDLRVRFRTLGSIAAHLRGNRRSFHRRDHRRVTGRAQGPDIRPRGRKRVGQDDAGAGAARPCADPWRVRPVRRAGAGRPVASRSSRRCDATSP